MRYASELWGLHWGIWKGTRKHMQDERGKESFWYILLVHEKLPERIISRQRTPTRLGEAKFTPTDHKCRRPFVTHGWFLSEWFTINNNQYLIVPSHSQVSDFNKVIVLDGGDDDDAVAEDETAQNKAKTFAESTKPLVDSLEVAARAVKVRTERSSSNFSCSLTSNITSHSMKNLAFHSLLRLKDDSCTSSHYLTYTFLFKRMGECTFWAWDWKGHPFHSWAQKVYSPNLSKSDCMSDVARICSIITFHLSKLWKVKFSILCDVIFLVRLQGKFDIDHSQEWKG